MKVKCTGYISCGHPNVTGATRQEIFETTPLIFT